jgi:hypothetical protein
LRGRDSKRASICGFLLRHPAGPQLANAPAKRFRLRRTEQVDGQHALERLLKCSQDCRGVSASIMSTPMFSKMLEFEFVVDTTWPKTNELMNRRNASPDKFLHALIAGAISGENGRFSAFTEKG